MFRSLKPRISFANLTALAALFIALGGSAYAAVQANSVKSRHIVNGTVKSKDVRDGTIKSRDVRDGTVKSRDVRDGNLKGEDVGADELDGKHIVPGGLGREHLTIKCGPTRTLIDGLCWDRSSVDRSANPLTASSACKRAGGRLPTPWMLREVARELDLRDDFHYTDSGWFDGAQLRSLMIRPGGGVSAFAPDEGGHYVCVYEPLA